MVPSTLFNEKAILKNSKLKEAFIISAIFFIIELPFLFFHEMWRDEINSWAVSLSSHSLTELFFNTRYEGHPKLWYIILFVLQKFSDNIFYMRVIHLLIAASAVYIFCFFSPFNFFKNFLFCFGYFFFYEYAVISRNYSIEMLLLFLSAGIYLKNREKLIILVSAVLFFVLQTNVFGVMLGIIFYGYIILDIGIKRLIEKKIILSFLIVLSGLILSAVSMIPPPDGGFALGYKTTFDSGYVLKIISIIFRSFVPIPGFTLHFWNSNYLDLPQYAILQFILSLLILFFVVFILFDRKKIVLFFCAGTFAILLFNYSKYYGDIRHHGHLFILFVLSCWLYFSDNSGKNRLNRSVIVNRVGRYFLTLVLLTQFGASAVAALYEIKFPFSNATSTAEYLKSNNLDKRIIAGDGDAQVAAISGIMNKEIYFIKYGRWGTHVRWDKRRLNTLDSNYFSRASELVKNSNTGVLLIFSYPVKSLPDGWILLKNFENAIEFDENYFIYKQENKLDSNYAKIINLSFLSNRIY